MPRKKPPANKGKRSPNSNEVQPGTPYNIDQENPKFKQGRWPEIKDPDEAIRQIGALAQINCTKREIAAVLNVSEMTLYRFFSRYPAAEEAFEDGQMKADASVRRKQHMLAERSASMAIHLGVQRLGQRPAAAFVNAGSQPDLGMGIFKSLLKDVDDRMREADRIRNMRTIEHKA